MRNAFAAEITELSLLDPNIVLLSGDIGNRLFDNFKKNSSNRFFNCGVAEANMTSVAAGLAMCGLRPVTYTITPFNTTRCLEQIRDDVCYHNLPVLIVGTGAGLSYANLGCTHHSCEDISFLRSIPNMTVLCPGDALELRALLRASLKHPGPVYMRIGKAKEPVVYTEIPQVTIGKANVLKKGNEICLLSTGNMLPIAQEIARDLYCPRLGSVNLEGHHSDPSLNDRSNLNHSETPQNSHNLSGLSIDAQLVSFHTVKPLDTALLETVFREFALVCTIEEHSLIGGLGAAVAEWMADHSPLPSKLLRCGTRDEFPHKIGTQAYVRDYFGLNVQTLKERIQHAYNCCHTRRNQPAPCY